MILIAILVAVVLAFLAFRFIVGMMKFVVIAIVVLLAIVFAHHAGAF